MSEIKQDTKKNQSGQLGLSKNDAENILEQSDEGSVVGEQLSQKNSSDNEEQKKTNHLDNEDEDNEAAESHEDAQDHQNGLV